jgi:multiple sugar transport system permease protein
MYSGGRNVLLGLLYVAPALAFVLAFTAYPLFQMVWVSLHSWSLIAAPKYLGLANFARAFGDSQFWVSLLYTLKYTLYITPILMVGGYLLALLTVENTPLKRSRAASCSCRSSSGSACRACSGCGFSRPNTASSIRS